jgi:hypothetical protein
LIHHFGASVHKLAISYQLSAISYQLSAISYQLSAISYQLSEQIVPAWRLVEDHLRDRSILPCDELTADC